LLPSRFNQTELLRPLPFGSWERSHAVSIGHGATPGAGDALNSAKRRRAQMPPASHFKERQRT
jgi:hypothetical protein